MNKELLVGMGNRIRQARLELDYKQEYVAERMGISVQTFSDTERGKKGLKLTNIIKLCSILNVSIDYILTGREPKLIDEADNLTDGQAEQIRNIIKSCIKLCSNDTK